MTSARQNGYLCCVRVSKDLAKQGHPQEIFLVSGPRMRQKRKNMNPSDYVDCLSL